MTRHDNLQNEGRWLLWMMVIGMFVVALSVTGCAGPIVEESEAATAPAPTAELVERGRYLVAVTGCNDCHTPWKMGPEGPAPDMSLALSGHPQELVMPPAPQLGDGPWVWSGAGTNTAFAGPWGVSFAANLTPDVNTGIGVWTEDIFIQTLRSGRHWGQSRPILPPMPWENYRQLSDEDLKAMFAYLKTLPPIENRVPLPVPPGGEQLASAEPAGW